MHLFRIKILIYDTIYMFRNRDFIFRRTDVRTGMVYGGLHAAITITIYKVSEFKIFELFNIPIWTYNITYLLTYLLHGAESFLSS